MMTMITKRHIRIVFYAAIASLPLLLAACSEAADGGSYATGDGDGLALRSLTVGVADAGTTRATGDMDTHTNYSAFAEGEQLYVVASVGASQQTAVYRCGELKSVNLGDFYSPDYRYYNHAEPVGAPLMASATSATEISAFAPYEVTASGSGATVSVTPLTTQFSVQQDQRTQLDLRASDLLYAEGTVAAGGTTATNAGGAWHQADKLSFQHQLSQLVVRFANSDANRLYPTLRSVRVTSGYRTIALSISGDGTMQTPLASHALSDPLSAGSPLTVFTSDDGVEINNNGNVVTDGAKPQLSSTDYVCILPPQTLAAGTTLIQAETSVGTISYYLPQAQTLLAGRSYRITLPVAPVAQTGAVAITDWDETTWTYTAQGTATTDTQYHADGAQLFNVGGVEFNMIRVKSGTATSGGSTYTVTDDYYIGETEVTQALWKAVMNGTLARTLGGTVATPMIVGNNYPMGGLGYNDVLKTGTNYFFTRLNEQAATQLPEGYEFALPTELQWRYAAAGGRYSHNYTYAGSNTVGDVSWYGAGSSGSTHPVALKQPNELGLYDMSGNAWEYAVGSGNNVCYGGSYYDVAEQSAITWVSGSGGADNAGGTRGFRLVLVPTALTRNFSYTGSVQTFTARRTGRYKIECWGASGGASANATVNASTTPGKGGYATGYVRLAKGSKLYVYVGGAGVENTSNGSAANGGWNGGGKSGSNYTNGQTHHSSGGGASDVRTVQCAAAANWKDNADGSESTDASLMSRLIVAGGGGGIGYYQKLLGNATGGDGGGLTGGDGGKNACQNSDSPDYTVTRFNTVTAPSGGTQMAGGAPGSGGGGKYGSTTYNNLTGGQAGSFGRGGNASASWGGGGGGGYYGGGGASVTTHIVSGGGGGSGYVGGVDDGQMTAGNAWMPAPAGGTELGHTGNGYVRITWMSE